MRYGLIAFCFLVLLSCQSNDEKLRKRIEPLLKSYIESSFGNELKKIDTLKILKIDSLTPDKDSFITMMALAEVREVVREVSKKKERQLYKDFDRAQLYGNLGSEFYDSEKRNLKSSEDQFHAIHMVGFDISNRFKSIMKLDSLGKIDSTTHTGYRVQFTLKGSDANNKAVDIDTGAVLLNNNFRVVEMVEGINNHYRNILKELL